jgi:hypothetical protein
MTRPRPADPAVRPADRPLTLTLRILGTLDLLAVLAAMAPRPWIVLLHEWCGLGPLPDGQIVGYLYRSTSLLYALHGAMILFVAGDVARYARLIRFLALLAIVHGALLVAVDAIEQMPGWWRWAEGPGFAAIGVLVLWLQRRAAAVSSVEAGDNEPDRSLAGEQVG